MTAQPIPAEFAKGTKIVRVSGYSESGYELTPGTITRTTKTLAFITFTRKDGTVLSTEQAFTYRRPFAQYGQPTPEPRLEPKGTGYSGGREEVYLADAAALEQARRHNSRASAQRRAGAAARELGIMRSTWIKRTDVEALIAELTAALADLPAES